MIKDAEAHAEEDRKRREEAETRNRAENLVYQTEKLVREQGDKLSSDEKSAVETRLADLKEALNGDDMDEISSRTETLMNASQEFTQKLYQQAAQSESGGAAGGSAGSGSSESAPNDDDVVDAEIVDDDEGKA
jgi:molecular chaperone DnaK